MTNRERVLSTFRFQNTDRPAYDLMENGVWPEFLNYFYNKHGLATADDVLSFLDADCRFTGMKYVGLPDTPWADYCSHEAHLSYSGSICKRPLADATCIADVDAHDWPDPSWWEPGDYTGIRKMFPNHVIVAGPPWMPHFCYASVAFGMEEALMKMLTEPIVAQAFYTKLTEIYLDMLKRHLEAAKGVIDICYLADDWASNAGLIMGPELWRKFIKPQLAQYIELIHHYGLYSMMHSCGSIRSILPDLIDIGLDGVTVFQTTTVGMNAREIAREFGGKMVFYGGIDCQHLLPFGSVDEVKAEVRYNVEAFAHCGGYIVSNSHHGIANIRPENIVAISEEAHALG